MSAGPLPIGFDPSSGTGILPGMQRSLLSLIVLMFAVSGCGAEVPSEVPLAASVKAALADPSQLPRAVTPVAAAVAVAGAAADNAAAENAAAENAADAASAGADADASAVDSSEQSEPAAVETDAASNAQAVAADTTTGETDTGTSPQPSVDAPAPTPKAAPAVTKPPEPVAAKPKKRPLRKRVAAKAPRKRAAKSRRAKAAPPPSQPVETNDPVPLPPGKDATDLYYEGKRALRARNYKAAIAALRASQQLRPSGRTLTLLGQAYFDANRVKDAEKALSRAGNRADALLLLATLYQQQGRSARARRAFKALLTYHPNHSRADWARRMLKTL